MILWVCSTRVHFGDEPGDFCQFMDSVPASPLSSISFIRPSSQGSLFQVRLQRDWVLSVTCPITLCCSSTWLGLLLEQGGKKIENEKEGGDTLHTLQTRGPCLTRGLDSHLCFTALLSCRDNAVLQLGWSLGRVRRKKRKRRNGKEGKILFTLIGIQRALCPVIWSERGGFSWRSYSSDAAAGSTWEQ